MGVPGFTAEVSDYRTKNSYAGLHGVGVLAGPSAAVIQPAQSGCVWSPCVGGRQFCCYRTHPLCIVRSCVDCDTVCAQGHRPLCCICHGGVWTGRECI